MRFVPALLFSLAFLACAVRGGEAPASIRALTPEEFAKAGLNKLTPEELTFLEAALALQAAPVAPAEKVVQATGKAAASFGAEQVTPAQRVVTEQELHAHIEGTIESFSGRAVFVLDNGQIWQQRIPDTVYFTRSL
jgi:hypothetical protein